MLKQSIRALATGAATFLTGLLVYDAPPASVNEFVSWAWQPGLQALLVMLGAFGINMASRSKPQGGGL